MSKIKIQGPSLCTLLTVLFVGLKLAHVIAWSWLWVLSPLWIPAAIVLAILIVILVIGLVIGLIVALAK